MKVTKEKFQEYMSQFKPLDVKITDIWSNKGNIIRGFKVNNIAVACIINWKSYWIHSGKC